MNNHFRRSQEKVPSYKLFFGYFSKTCPALFSASIDTIVHSTTRNGSHRSSLERAVVSSSNYHKSYHNSNRKSHPRKQPQYHLYPYPRQQSQYHNTTTTRPVSQAPGTIPQKLPTSSSRQHTIAPSTKRAPVEPD